MTTIPYQIKETQGARVRFCFYYGGQVYTRVIYDSISDEDIEVMTDSQLFNRLITKVKKYLTLLETANKRAAATLLMCAEKTPWESVNCKNCTNCKNCVNCVNCENLHSCESCESCVGCINCKNCTNCKNCVNCDNSGTLLYCSNCNVCSHCEKCDDCVYCNFCENSRNCQHCTTVKNSYGCRSCKNCIECKYLVHRSNMTFECGDERIIRFDDDNEIPF